MVSLTQIVTVLLLLLSCLLVASDAKKSTTAPVQQCTVTVSQMLTDSSSRYNTYTATVTNVGSSAASSIVLSTSASLKSIDGVDQSGDGTYTLSSVTTLGVTATYSFSYTVKKQTTVQWTASCASAASTPTTAKATTQAPKATTTQAPKATTTQAPKATTTQAPAKTTTQAPAKTTTPAPVKASTQAPTQAAPAPVTQATTKPGPGLSGGKTCSSGWWQPSPMTTWQWQISGTVDTTFDVQMYDIDLFDATPALINTLHAAGRTVICYFSTQYENWRPDAASWTTAVLGSNLDDWVGEKYVDIRSPVVRSILSSRLDLAVSKGCDGVEPDNVDGFEASTGFPLTAADQLDFNKFVANAAHTRGLSVGLKNDGDQAAALQPYFDWALNEQCNQYSECTALNSFISAGKAVFNCEYSGSATTVCPKMVTAKFSTIFKALALEAPIKSQCCTYAAGGCAVTASYSCGTSKRSLDLEESANTIDEVSA